ncbi:MAG: hypothetical protein JNL83_13715 [Myxococcales bacterium]|nr:hypothetical protein [Myxococcales bacterium]
MGQRRLCHRFVPGLLLVAACLPPDDKVAKPVVPVDPDVAALVHTWVVADHIVGASSAITASEAASFRGRHIEISRMGYVSPWQGTCEEAGRTKRTRSLGEIIGELDMSSSAASEATAFGLADPVVEYRLSCTDRKRPPPLTVFVSHGRAMTCYGGVCFLMKSS